MKELELEESLVSLLGDSGGHDLLVDAAELALDTFLEDGVVKDIPVVGTVAKLYNVAVGVQGYVFARKIKRFISRISEIPKEDRDEFASKIRTDNKMAAQTAEVLICLLDRVDDLEKADLLARAFSGYVYGDFDFVTFRRLAAAIDRSLVSDHHLIEQLEKPMQLEAYIGDILVGAGLAQVDSIPSIKFEGWKPTYVVTSLGRLFRQVVILGGRREN